MRFPSSITQDTCNDQKSISIIGGREGDIEGGLCKEDLIKGGRARGWVGGWGRGGEEEEGRSIIIVANFQFTCSESHK